MPVLKTRQRFIEDARKVHGDRYDYELVKYKGTAQPVAIQCLVHGAFQQTPKKHLTGHGCRHCPKRSDVDQKTFLDRVSSVHGDTYCFTNSHYEARDQKVRVDCPRHGPFHITPAGLFYGRGCYACAVENMSMTKDEWLEKARMRHGDKYVYDELDYTGSLDKVAIRCPSHGIFWQKASSHLEGSGCPRCVHRVSKPSIEWLDATADIDDTLIQHGGNGGEVKLTGTRWHADGFSLGLNKVYEFLGDYYHGNPRVYSADDLNKRCKCTMGELYDKTYKRRKLIEDLGYAYEEIWEDEFNAAKTLLTLCDARA